MIVFIYAGLFLSGLVVSIPCIKLCDRHNLNNDLHNLNNEIQPIGWVKNKPKTRPNIYYYMVT